MTYLWEASQQVRVALWAEEGSWQEALSAWIRARRGRLVAVGGEATAGTEPPPGVEVAPDLETLLRDDRLGVVHLMAPPSRVLPLVRALLQAGKHVLLGSPPPAEPAAVEELLRRGEEGEAVLLPVGGAAPAADVRRVVTMGARGMVGRVRLMEVEAEEGSARSSGAGRGFAGVLPASGDVLLRLGPPLFGNLPRLLGEPLAVAAVRARLSDSMGDEEAACVQVRCTQGWCSARLLRVAVPRPSVTLIGTTGRLRMDETGAVWLYMPEWLPGEAAEVRLPARAPAPGAELDRAIEAAWRRNRQALRDLAVGLQVTLAAYRASEVGRAVETSALGG